jgi:hypothetical protein
MRQAGRLDSVETVAWPADPEELLAGPRGRRLCFELVGRDDDGVRQEDCPGWDALGYESAAVGSGQLAAELASLVSRADLDAIASGSDEAGLLALVAVPVGDAMYWQPPWDWDLALAEPAMADVLAPVARAVTRAPAARWWSSPADRDRQQYVQFLAQDAARERDDDPTPALSGAAGRVADWLADTLEDERRAVERPADPSAPYSGYWWSTPALSGLVTTTRSLPGLGAIGLELVEDGMGWTDARCWPLRPRPDARVYEIHGPEDWTGLVTRYPLDVSKARRHDWWDVTGWAGTWLIPDFSTVAADYDAVHLTVGGYLTTAGRGLAVPGDGGPGDGSPGDGSTASGSGGRLSGYASALREAAAGTLLAGWNPDETYWLADVLKPAGPSSRWTATESAISGWARAPDGAIH